MPFITGSANSLSDLLTAVQNACVANGWALNGTVLSKGSLYVDLNYVAGAPYNHLSVCAGNGLGAGNVLSDPAPRVSHFGPLTASGPGGGDWNWPCTYNIHVMTGHDEVYVFVNYLISYWQLLAFGQSPSAGNPGTGNWHHAMIPAAYSNQAGPAYIYWNNGAVYLQQNYSLMLQPGPFFISDTSWNYSPCDLTSYIHGCLDDTTGAAIWSHVSTVLNYIGSVEQNGCVSAFAPTQPLLAQTPNSFNNETVLIPVKVAQGRPNSKTSLIGEFSHARFTRNDYLPPGTVLTLGSDRWKVYPMYAQNTAVRNGARTADSGTFALAVRYDGP